MESKKTYIKLLFIIGCLCALNITTHYLRIVHDHNYLLGFARFFNFDRESNLPTWFSSIILFISSVLLLIISKSKDVTFKRHWAFLSFAFLFLSLDEVGRFHEKLDKFVKMLTGPTEIWLGLLPYIIILLLLSYTYIKFLFSLSIFYRKIFFYSGSVYILGALGFDVFSSFFFHLPGMGSTYVLLFTIEETLEMVAIATFIYGLLCYMEEHNIQITINP